MALTVGTLAGMKIATFAKDQTTWSGKLVGIVDYENVNADVKVILKIETEYDYDYFVAFNRAVRFNRGTGQGEDLVLVTQLPHQELSSMLVAELNEGQSFSVKTKDDSVVDIQVDRIDLSSDPAYAQVTAKEH